MHYVSTSTHCEAVTPTQCKYITIELPPAPFGLEAGNNRSPLGHVLLFNPPYITVTLWLQLHYSP